MTGLAVSVPLWLKILVPGYRAKWRHRYAALLDHLNELAPRLIFGREDNIPWVEPKAGGCRLYGFWTEPANLEVIKLLGRALPPTMPPRHFRLMKDYINCYLYPHMRPDLKPEGYTVDQLFGFHGQHKDAIADLPDPALRAELTRAFKPRPDDVAIDCGAFLGFGEARLAPDMADGHVYAIEASAECHALLTRNMTRNRLANVTAIHRAVWNKETTRDLQSGFAQANTLVEEVYQGERVETVPTITVDGVVAQYGIARVDMLSLTLNGAEVEALEGARRTLADLRPRIRLAGWYSREGRRIWEWTKPVLEEHGYRVFVGPRGNVMALPR